MATLDIQDNTTDTGLRKAHELMARNRIRQLCEAFGQAGDARDGRREGHARDAAFYAGLIAREMHCTPEEVEDIELAALVHGIGKIAIPDAIIQKNTPLEPYELRTVRRATASGARWLQGADGFESVAEYVRHQGERWDGSGYPDQLAGEDIPLGARILSVALCFTAMIRPRADRPAMSVVNGALEFLAYDAGLSLDPKVVRAFLAAMGRELQGDAAQEDDPESAAEEDGSGEV